MADSPCTPDRAPAKPASSSSSSCRGRRKWRKPKDKPKPPLSAYDIFVQQQISLMQSPTALDFQRVSALWNSLNAEARSVYEQEAKKDQERFAKEIEEWQNRKFQIADEEVVEDSKRGSSISSQMPASVWSAAPSDESANRAAITQHVASCVNNKWTHIALAKLPSFEYQTESQAEQMPLQFADGIDEWRKRKFQLSTDIEDQRDRLSSAFSSTVIGKFTTNDSPGHDRPTEGITAWNATLAENYTSNSSHPSHDGTSSTERASLAKSPRLKSKGLKPAPLPSRPATESPRMAGTSGLLLAAASARHDLSSEQVEKYIRPESLTQLVAQLEHEEVEFLASLRHAS